MSQQNPVKTFICYAHEDHAVVEGLKKQLAVFEKRSLLQIWSDGKILPGEPWDKAIKIQLEQAELILLFVSVDFINSEYIEKTELKAALQRHRDGQAVLIPIIVRSCHWQEYFDIGQFQALPAKARPILSSHFPYIDEAFFEIAEGIRKTAEERRQQKAAQYAREQAEQEAQNRAKLLRTKDEAAWKAACEENTAEAYESYLDQYTLHEAEAHAHISALETAAARERAARKAAEKAAEQKRREAEAAEAEATRRREEAERRHNDPFHDEMIRIKGGAFDMGDVFGEGESREKPVHRVTVPDFYLAKYPVTQAQWRAVMGEDPSHFKGERLPVEQVSWDDAQAFIQKLKDLTGLPYRLPTEAEWEYAAREGGKKVRFGNGKDTADPAQMNFNALEKYKQAYSKTGEYRQQTTPVDAFAPNALGLFDMSGNVWEWCQDWYHDSYKDAPADGSAWIYPEGSLRVIRGGSCYYNPRYCRAAIRSLFTPGLRYYSIGFRLARTN
jgi:formylglycine-generating enzyme required for sulfatase activity